MLSARVSSCECYNSTACPFNAHTAPTSLAPRTLFWPGLITVIVPRHPQRAAAIMQQASELGASDQSFGSILGEG
eukprot:7591797-Pyramimonas_sp.AAC.1